MLRWGHRFLLGQKVAPLPPPPASPKFPANRPALLLSHSRRSSSRKRNTHGARSEYHGTQPNLRYSGKVYINQPMQVKKQHKMPHQHRSQPPPQSHSMTMIPGLTLLAAEQAREQALEALKNSAMASPVAHPHVQTHSFQGTQGTVISASSSQIVTMTTPINALVQVPLPPSVSSYPPEKMDKRKHSDPRTAPSAASGGIPDPTMQYMSLSFDKPVTLSKPRRILVIMDLNGTLLYRPSKKKPSDFVERPNAKKFMSYCLDNFYVAIWSSARPHNVQNMVRQLLTPEQVKQCVVIWARDKLGLTAADYNARVQCYKRLTMLWNEPQVQKTHPEAKYGGRWDQTNTVLVDDSIEKGRSEPNNSLVLPEFEGLSKEKADVLPQVHDYLNSLCSQRNISAYMRETPFELDDSYKLE